MSAIEVLIGEAALGWAVGKSIDVMLHSIGRLEESLGEKLDRLLNSPFETGKNALELASKYERQGNQQLREQQLSKAKDLFDQAGSQLKDLEQIHSYCLAGLCCELLKDDTGRMHFFQLALDKLLEYKPVVSDNKESQFRWLLGAAAGATLGGTVLGLFGTLVGAAVGGFLGSKTVNKPDENSVKLSGFDCSLPELKSAIIKGLQSKFQ